MVRLHIVQPLKLIQTNSSASQRAQVERKVIVRFGIVLAREGGALARMLPVFNVFAGGPLGSGRQWFSWIHRWGSPAEGAPCTCVVETAAPVLCWASVIWGDSGSDDACMVGGTGFTKMQRASETIFSSFGSLEAGPLDIPLASS